MKKLQILLLLLLLSASLQTACNSAPSEDMSTPDVKCDYDLLSKKSLEGDSVAFCELSAWAMAQHKYRNFHYVASIVANRYNHPDAYFLLYWDYMHPDTEVNLPPKEQLKLLDKRTRALCLYYLLKSRELGREAARYAANDIFVDTNSIPTANSYLDTLKKYN